MLHERTRLITICLMTNGNRILCAREQDHVKGDHFWRPLGGGIEFRELSRDAVIREMREETGEEICDIRLVDIMENPFTYEGEDWHQIVFVYDARFSESTKYESTSVACREEEFNLDFTAEWRTITEIEQAGDRLVPEGLDKVVADLLVDRERTLPKQ
jgi:ADP-ribose pyrophosphatase YjhB (NUDIX family)